MSQKSKPMVRANLPVESTNHGHTTPLPYKIQRAFSLTPRQAEIYMQISHGHTNAAIGAVLGISKRTVDKHVEHILHKLNVPNRTAATGLITQHVTRKKPQA